MNKTSRRSLALWACGQITAGASAKSIAGHLAAVLIENKMTDQAGFLLEDIIWELERAGALTYAKVTTAQPLSKHLETALKTHLKKTTKASEIIMENKVDKSAIGGLRVETAGKVWDQTVARKLTELREVF